MRFKTKYDLWLVVVLIFVAILTCVAIPAVRFHDFGVTGLLSVFSLLTWAIWLIVIPCTLPQYYEVREDGLFIRQGWKRTLLAYASLTELQTMRDWSSAAVYSADRILIVTDAGKRFLIAVTEEGRFLSEVSKRCPQFEQRGFGLGIPFAAPTIL
jgi:hypothetical protein